MREPMACTCGECDSKEPKRFKCTACKRDTPWCCGASDERKTMCDDCWASGRRKQQIAKLVVLKQTADALREQAEQCSKEAAKVVGVDVDSMDYIEVQSFIWEDLPRRTRMETAAQRLIEQLEEEDAED